MTNVRSRSHKTSTVAPKLLDLWQSVPFLAGLEPKIVSALAAVATRHAFPANAMIFSEGDPVAGLFLIEEGSVKVCRFSKDGREHTLRVFQRGDTFNDVPAFDGGPNAATAIAFTDVVVWRVARSDLHRLAERYPALAWALLESIARRTRYLVNLVQDLSARNVKARLARLLLEQAQAEEPADCAQMLTQEEIASRLGTVREVVGRALRNLATNGIIEFDRHRIVIRDPERLAEEADL
jgi:CRP/FNR family cyclic AMP-dependent transcriptional regulator